MRRFLTVLALAAAVWGAHPGFVHAQATGTIAGIVTDESGAFMPGVTIEVTNVATNQVRTATTGADGHYAVFLLQPGPYTVKATLAGFRTAIREGITVTVESTSRVDVRLMVGQLEETVTVSGAAPLVETRSATMGI